MQVCSPAGMVLFLTFSNHSSGIDITFMCPQTTEEAPVQEIPIICYIQEVLGQPTLEVGHLDMLTHVLYSLKGIGKIRVTAHQHCHIIEIVPGKIQQVCSQHNIYTLLHRDTL